MKFYSDAVTQLQWGNCNWTDAIEYLQWGTCSDAAAIALIVAYCLKRVLARAEIEKTV
jgi:hypothetical protein